MVDTSGSMKEGKLDIVKTNLKEFIKSADVNDRISIVGFADEGKRFCKLTRDNSKQIEDAIDKLEPEGITNIDSGLIHSLEVLAQRKNANPISSIMMVSDGLDFSGKDYYETFKQYHSKIKGGCYIQTIGLGDAHDPFICIPVAGMTQGQFYPCAKFEDLSSTMK